MVSNGRLFADDTNLTYAANDLNKITSVLNDDLKILQNWLNMNKLSLNVMKTKYMFVASRQRLSNIPEQLDISISGIEVKRVKSYKCLGLELDEGLTWESHVSVIISKVSKVIGVLRRLKSLLPLSALVLIYNSLIQPHFDYCSVIWDNLAGGLGQKLQRMQNRAAQIITSSDYYTRSSEILRSLNWIYLEDRRALQFKKLMYKMANNMVPSYLTDKFIHTSSVHEDNLRGPNHKFFVPRPLSEYHKKSFSYRGAILWNNMPVQISSAQSLSEFMCLIS